MGSGEMVGPYTLQEVIKFFFLILIQSLPNAVLRKVVKWCKGVDRVDLGSSLLVGRTLLRLSLLGHQVAMDVRDHTCKKLDLCQKLL